MVKHRTLRRPRGSRPRNSMEVSRRRILQRHLEPARPLRRCVQVDIVPEMNDNTCTQSLMEVVGHETNITIEQFCKIVNLGKEKEGRISYSRDFLIALACCPEAKRKPEFLPEHPIVLPKARHPEHLYLSENRWNEGKNERMADMLHQA